MASKLKELGYMMDCSRGAVAKVETVKNLVDILSGFGYNYLMLYTEDTYEIKGEPYFGYMRGRYSQSELAEMDAYCQSKGMELRPCIQTLAHLGRLQAYDRFSGYFDIDDVLLVGDDKVYELIEKMFSSMSNNLKSRKIHIGMDEAFRLGRGRYIDRFGYAKKSQIITAHLKRVADIAKKYGYTCYIWADMLENAYNESNGSLLCEIPDNVIPMMWGYEKAGEEKAREKTELYKKLSPKVLASCGGVIKWVGFSPLNTYSMAALEEQISLAKEYDLESYLVTGWGDGAADASQFSTLPGLFYASVLAKGEKLDEKAKARFEECVGMGFDDFMNVDALSTLDPKVDYRNSRNCLSFVHLYSDLLQNPMIETQLDKYETLYPKACEKLLRCVDSKQWGYIFKSLYALGEVDSILCTLGKRILDTYSNHEDLTPCIEKAKKAHSKLEEFIKIYEAQWAKENKAFGYEKQLLRLGGLKERIRYVIDVLSAYSNGKISQIDELEEKHLPKIVGDKPIENPDEAYAHWYRYFVSSGLLNDM